MKNYVSSGEKHHQWVVLKLLKKANSEGKSMCLAKCSCGTEREVSQYNLKTSRSKSCGCLAKQKNGDRVRTHGLHKHPLYPRWKSMVRRCHAPEDSRYKYYGARGVSVCETWRYNPQKYIEWFEKQSNDLTLTVDRIDNDGDYSPTNCRLVDMKIQNNNKRPRKDRLLDKTVLKIRSMYKQGHSMAHISRILDVSRGTVRNVVRNIYYKEVK